MLVVFQKCLFFVFALMPISVATESHAFQSFVAADREGEGERVRE